jgi:hypothetical protein
LFFLACNHGQTRRDFDAPGTLEIAASEPPQVAAPTGAKAHHITIVPHPEIARLRREVGRLTSISTADIIIETILSEQLREELGAPFLQYMEGVMDGLRFKVKRTEVVESRGGWRVRMERLLDVIEAYYHFFRPIKVKVFGTVLKRRVSE